MLPDQQLPVTNWASSSATTSYSVWLPIQQLPLVFYMLPISATTTCLLCASNTVTMSYSVWLLIQQLSLVYCVLPIHPVRLSVKQLPVIQLCFQFSNYQLSSRASSSATTFFQLGFQFSTRFFPLGFQFSNYYFFQLGFQFNNFQFPAQQLSVIKLCLLFSYYLVSSWAANLATTSFPIQKIPVIQVGFQFSYYQLTSWASILAINTCLLCTSNSATTISQVIFLIKN